MNGPLQVDGWLKVPYSGHDLATVEIAVTAGEPQERDWRPAGLDWHGPRDDRTRVAQVRPPKGRAVGRSVWMRVNGHAERIGLLR